MKDKKLNLLIVDDDADDQFLFQNVITELNANHNITSVYNGLQLIEYLFKKGSYTNSSDKAPDCIFLDLHMPLLNGFDALRRIKTHPQLKDIPIYIFTTSDSEEDRKRSIALGASGFYTKVAKFDKLKLILNDIISSAASNSTGKTDVN